MYTQDDLDIDNAIATLSKISFFKDLNKFKLDKYEVISMINNVKNIGKIKAEEIFYEKAFLYYKTSDMIKKNKEFFLSYVLL